MSQGSQSKGLKLRELLAREEILVMPGVFDGFSARLIERAGFAAAQVSGAGLSEARLGWPDVGLLGLEDNVRAVRSFAGCTDLILLADGDTGYGNAVNVFFTVRAFEEAGAAGVMIEDQVSPKRCGHMAGKDVISAEEMVEKVHAAVEAKRDPHFVIKARTDAAGVQGLDEAIRRLNLYAEAGADLLFADALLSVEHIGEVARNVPKPLAVNMGFGIRSRPTTPLVPAKQLQRLGVKVVDYPRLLTSTALRGMEQGLAVLQRLLQDEDAPQAPELAVGFDELNALVGLAKVRELEARYASKPVEVG